MMFTLPSQNPSSVRYRARAACVLVSLSLVAGVAEAQQGRAAPPRAQKAEAEGEGEEPEVPPFETGVEYEPESPRSRVTFNLEDAELSDLVRLISQLTGKRFILPTKIRNLKATVYAPTKVTVAEAYQAFLSILEINGLTVVPAGRYLKIVEADNVQHRPISLYSEDATVPRGDRYVTHILDVENVSAEDVAELFERFKSKEGAITTYAPTNSLIITDTGTNIRRMKAILEGIDVPRTGEQIWIEPVHYANATELADRLAEIYPPTTDSGGGSKGKKKGSKGPAQSVGNRSADFRVKKLLADERTNSLIIIATEPAYLRILQTLKHLDIPMEGEGRIHVHYLQHSDSEEISNTLSELVGRRSGGSQKRGQKGQQETEVFEGDIGITSHETSNALVISASTHDYAALRGVIDQLDVKRRQVFIEAVIMELNVDRSSDLGLGFHGGVPDVPEEGSLSVLGFNAGKSISAVSPQSADMLTGLAVGVRGPIVAESEQLIGISLPAFGVAINAMASSSNANILSTPHLIAMDNVEAEITVGGNVPLQTSSLGGLGGLGGLGALGALGGQQGQQGGAGLGALQGMGLGGTVPRQDVGTTIRITPHINESDEIRLEITEEISEAGAPSEQGNLGVRSINRTQANTQVSVRDQQTVVIGGLMRDTVSTSESKVPILGDIPLLGTLFRRSQRSTQKKNLILFLTPYIIRAPDDLRSIYERKMRERQEFLDRYFVFGGHDYEPPVDYSRTRGLVGEMVASLHQLEEERRLYEEAQQERPELQHQPKAPVGEAFEEEAGENEMTIEPDDGQGQQGEQGGAPEANQPPEQGPEASPAEQAEED